MGEMKKHFPVSDILKIVENVELFHNKILDAHFQFLMLFINPHTTETRAYSSSFK